MGKTFRLELLHFFHVVYTSASGKLWRYIYDKIQYSVVEIKSSKSGMHQSKVAWEQADSVNTHSAKGQNARRQNPKRHHANRHHTEANRHNAERHHANRHNAKRHYANRQNAKRQYANGHNVPRACAL